MQRIKGFWSCFRIPKMLYDSTFTPKSGPRNDLECIWDRLKSGCWLRQPPGSPAAKVNQKNESPLRGLGIGYLCCAAARPRCLHFTPPALTKAVVFSRGLRNPSGRLDLHLLPYFLNWIYFLVAPWSESVTNFNVLPGRVSCHNFGGIIVEL